MLFLHFKLTPVRMSAAKASKRIATSFDYGSEFEQDSEVERKKVSRRDLDDRNAPPAVSKPSKTAFVEERSKDEARYMRHHHISTNAYARHKELVNNYLMYYGGKISDFDNKSAHRNDRDIIRENHQFVWEEGEEGESWDKKLAKKYYDKLFKEYCLADLSRYKEKKIAMRWRTEREIVSGKGQFVCGNKACSTEEGLKSWEVNFAYVEKEVKKNSLVKLRLCYRCSSKLNYHKKNREVSTISKEVTEEASSFGTSKDTDKKSFSQVFEE
ncbi:protein FRA10AC1 homolog isoform X3 [Watersipora subatra]|uniref:protein FRA10AC1 homolog isoform X3 n=1 Tax=Watersipora subatra TaxID=2589382 RepID=UPI00355B78BC